MKFNDLDWHDSIIQNIVIDRSNPGRNDTIKIVVIWPNNIKNILCFEDVYWANFDMNFGLVGSESVLRAYSEGREYEIVKNFYLRWKGFIDNIDLSFYEIETSSTKSKIKIIANRFTLRD